MSHDTIVDTYSCPNRYLLHRPNPRRSKHNAPMRDRHERQRNPDRHGMAASRLKLVSLYYYPLSCHLSSNKDQDMGMGPRMVTNRSRHRHLDRLPAMLIPSSTAILERGQRATHHDAEYGRAAKVQW